MTQVQWRSCNIKHNKQDQDLQAKERSRPMSPEVRVRYVVSVECLTHLKNAQHGAKSVINVAIKITSVLNVGSKQSGGAGNRKSHSTSRGCKGQR